MFAEMQEIARHWKKIAGGLVGLLAALILVTFGFWKGLFIILCAFVGVFIGWHLEVGNGIKELLELFKGSRRQ